MVGYGGTSKTGRQYHYYMCKNARRKKCGKKIVSKSYIEDRVVNECLKMLTEEKIRFIAKKVAEECAKSPGNLTAKALKKAIREADTAIENLWKAIEQGRAVEMLTDRLNKRMAEKAELEAQLAVEENKKITLTEAQILAFLDYVCEMPADDVNKRRAIINIFVHSIYLYDDHSTLIINASKKPLSIDNIPLDDTETAFEGETRALEGCSSLSTPAPPVLLESKPSWARVSFCPFLLDFAFFCSFLCSFTRIIYPYFPCTILGMHFSHTFFRYKIYITCQARVRLLSQTGSKGSLGHCSDEFPHNQGIQRLCPDTG